MTKITANQVKELQEKTGYSMMECKHALKIREGDVEYATEYLQNKGLAIKISPPEMRFPKWAARLKYCHACKKDVKVIEKMGGTICSECRVILGG